MKKHPDSDLEKIKSFYMTIGLLVSLSLVLVIFEWEFKGHIGDSGQKEITSLGDEIISVSSSPTYIVEVDIISPSPIKAVKKDRKSKTKKVKSEGDKDSLEVMVHEKEEIFDDIVLTNVDKKPSYPGGKSKMVSFLNDNLIYPQMAIESNVSGVVSVEFIIRRDGKIDSVKVISGIGAGCDEESIRVVGSMPNWIPARYHDREVSVRYTLPIRFDLR